MMAFAAAKYTAIFGIRLNPEGHAIQTAAIPKVRLAQTTIQYTTLIFNVVVVGLWPFWSAPKIWSDSTSGSGNAKARKATFDLARSVGGYAFSSMKCLCQFSDCGLVRDVIETGPWSIVLIIFILRFASPKYKVSFICEWTNLQWCSNETAKFDGMFLELKNLGFGSAELLFDPAAGSNCDS